MSWQNVRLDSICSMLSGNAWSASKFKESGVIPIIRIQNLGSNENEKFIWWDDPYDKKFIVTKGDLLLSLSGSIKIDRWLGDDALLNQRIVKLTPNKAVDERWFFWQIKYIILDIERMGKWALVNNVSITDLKEVQIPLPPLPIQRRIAEILDAADALKRKDQELLKKYDELTQAIFFDMFGDDLKRKKYFEGIMLSNVVAKGKNKIRTGPFGSDLLHSEFVDSGITVLGIDNVVNNAFERGKERYITPEKFQSLSRYQVYPRDVLISIMGTVGRCAVVPNDIELAINTKHLVAITLNEDLINPAFLSYILTHDHNVLVQLKSKARGAIMDGLNMGLIKDLILNIPPVELQEKFIKQLNYANSMKRIVNKNNTITLFDSLIQKAFNGELAA